MKNILLSLSAFFITIGYTHGQSKEALSNMCNCVQTKLDTVMPPAKDLVNKCLSYGNEEVKKYSRRKWRRALKKNCFYYQAALRLGKKKVAPNVYLDIALKLNERGDYFEALNFFNQAEKKGLESHEMDKGRGIAYYKTGEAFRGLQYLYKAYTREPENAALKVILADALYLSNDAPTAIIILREIKDLPEYRCEALENMARCYSLTDQLDSAIVYYEAVLTCNPDHTEVLSELGFVYLKKKKYKKAIEKYSTALKNNSEDMISYLHLAMSYQGDQNFEEAEKAYKKYISFDEENPTGTFQLALLYQSVGKYIESNQILEKTIELNPDFAPIYFYEFQNYMALNDSVSALKALDMALEKNPGEWFFFLKRADLHKANKNTQAQIADLKSYLHWKPSDCDVNKELIELLKKGKLEKDLKLYTERAKSSGCN